MSDERSRFDPLSRYYNSQITAHVGYGLAISVLTFQLVLAYFTAERFADFIDVTWPYSALLITIAAGSILLFAVARIQYYVMLSEIAWEFQGVKDMPQAQAKAIKSYANPPTLVQKVLYERIFSSSPAWDKLNVVIQSADQSFDKDCWPEVRDQMARRRYYQIRLFGLLPLMWLIPLMVLFANEEAVSWMGLTSRVEKATERMRELQGRPVSNESDRRTHHRGKHLLDPCFEF